MNKLFGNSTKEFKTIILKNPYPKKMHLINLVVAIIVSLIVGFTVFATYTIGIKIALCLTVILIIYLIMLALTYMIIRMKN